MQLRIGHESICNIKILKCIAIQNATFLCYCTTRVQHSFVVLSHVTMSYSFVIAYPRYNIHACTREWVANTSLDFIRVSYYPAPRMRERD